MTPEEAALDLLAKAGVKGPPTVLRMCLTACPMPITLDTAALRSTSACTARDAD